MARQIILMAAVLGGTHASAPRGDAVNQAILEGYLQAKDTQEFLTCDSSSCHFMSSINSALMFKRETGSDGEYKFVVQGGSYDGYCLDREHCHSSTSNARMSDCDHCGAKHWQLTPGGQLAEDKIQNCIQNDGYVRHCSDGYQQIQFYQTEKSWNPPVGDWTLAASTVGGAVSTMLQWGVESSDSDSTTTKWASTIEASFKAGVIFAGVSLKVSVSTEISHTMSKTLTRSMSETCSITCQHIPQTPFIFVYQWFTEHTHGGETDVTRATSCNYMCIYGKTGRPNPPKCAITCCYDASCQTCAPGCGDSFGRHGEITSSALDLTIV